MGFLPLKDLAVSITGRANREGPELCFQVLQVSVIPSALQLTTSSPADETRECQLSLFVLVDVIHVVMDDAVERNRCLEQLTWIFMGTE